MGTSEDIAAEKYFTPPMEAKDAVIRASEVLAALESKEGALSKAYAVLDYLSPKIDGILEDGRKAGREEVVKWCVGALFSALAMGRGELDFSNTTRHSLKLWHSQLAAWGIKEAK